MITPKIELELQIFQKEWEINNLFGEFFIIAYNNLYILGFGYKYSERCYEEIFEFKIYPCSSLIVDEPEYYKIHNLRKQIRKPIFKTNDLYKFLGKIKKKYINPTQYNNIESKFINMYRENRQHLFQFKRFKNRDIEKKQVFIDSL